MLTFHPGSSYTHTHTLTQDRSHATANVRKRAWFYFEVQTMVACNLAISKRTSSVRVCVCVSMEPWVVQTRLSLTPDKTRREPEKVRSTEALSQPGYEPNVEPTLDRSVPQPCRETHPTSSCQLDQTRLGPSLVQTRPIPNLPTGVSWLSAYAGDWTRGCD